jgi:CHAD domain-containing protein
MAVEQKSLRLLRRWEKQARKLARQAEELLRLCRTQGAVEDIHALRVTLRRLRLAVRLGKSTFPAPHIARFRAWAERVSRATSSVRDLDIAIAWLASHKAPPALIEQCLALRVRQWLRCKKLIPPRPRGLRNLMDHPIRKCDAAGVAKRFTRLEKRFEAHVAGQANNFRRLPEEDRHNFRRAVRWWRYLREMALPAQKVPGDVLISRLLRAQEALGAAQDLALAKSCLGRTGRSAAQVRLLAELAREKRAQADAGYEALRELRRYLR